MTLSVGLVRTLLRWKLLVGNPAYPLLHLWRERVLGKTLHLGMRICAWARGNGCHDCGTLVILTGKRVLQNPEAVAPVFQRMVE